MLVWFQLVLASLVSASLTLARAEYLPDEQVGGPKPVICLLAPLLPRRCWAPLCYYYYYYSSSSYYYYYFYYYYYYYYY